MSGFLIFYHDKSFKVITTENSISVGNVILTAAGEALVEVVQFDKVDEYMKN